MKRILSLIIIVFLCCNSFAQSSKHQLPLSINQNRISLGNSTVQINQDGFPKYIHSFEQLLYEPIHFHYFTSPKTQEKLIPDTLGFKSSNKRKIQWKGSSSSDHLSQEVEAKIFKNGLMKFQIRVSILKDLKLSNITFHIPIIKPTAQYLYGLNEKSYLRPDTVKWHLKNLSTIKPNVWIGNDHSGLYIRFNTSIADRAVNGWTKNKDSKLQINIKGSSMLCEYSTGSMDLKAGNVLQFDFNLFIDPFMDIKELSDISKLFNYYQKIDLNSKK